MPPGGEAPRGHAGDALWPRCAGVDAHKADAAVGARCCDRPGQALEEARTFSAMAQGLPASPDWLAGHGATEAAVGSTGVYGKPASNVSGDRDRAVAVNAEHIKRAPGRKTGAKDRPWTAPLLRRGLLKAGFVPPEPGRGLRDPTRQRARLIRGRASAADRIRKVSEDADVEPAAVAAGARGVSDRDMPEALVAGEADPEKLAGLARRRLREEIPALQPAPRGRVTGRRRLLLRLHPDRAGHPGGVIGRPGARIGEARAPFAEAAERLQTVPGIGQRAAEAAAAEIGPDVARSPTAGRLASWAGMSPGDNGGAGKRRSGRAAQGSRWLRRLLVQAAWAASHTRGAHLAARYRRPAERRGRKRTLVAVGPAPRVITCRALKRGTTYAEPGPDFLDRPGPERSTRQPVKRLPSPGHKVTREPLPAA